MEFAVWEHEKSPTPLPNGVRVRWVYDDDHETVGRFAYDTEEETHAAEDAEIEAIRTGEMIPLGCIVEADTGERLDSLWGIVIEPDEAKLVEFFQHSIEVPTEVEIAELRHERLLKALKLSQEMRVAAYVRAAQKGE